MQNAHAMNSSGNVQTVQNERAFCKLKKGGKQNSSILPESLLEFLPSLLSLSLESLSSATATDVLLADPSVSSPCSSVDKHRKDHGKETQCPLNSSLKICPVIRTTVTESDKTGGRRSWGGGVGGDVEREKKERTAL